MTQAKAQYLRIIRAYELVERRYVAGCQPLEQLPVPHLPHLPEKTSFTYYNAKGGAND